MTPSPAEVAEAEAKAEAYPQKMFAEQPAYFLRLGRCNCGKLLNYFASCPDCRSWRVLPKPLAAKTGLCGQGHLGRLVAGERRTGRRVLTARWHLAAKVLGAPYLAIVADSDIARAG